MMSLLNKTRMLNKILQKSGTELVVFNDICNLLGEVLNCNVYIISKTGDILGSDFSESFDNNTFEKKFTDENNFPEKYNNKLLGVYETVSNITDKEIFNTGESELEFDDKLLMVVPIIGGRERLATLFLARFDEKFTDEDIVLGEYSATIIGLEILKAKNDQIEEEARKKAVVQLAIGTLSYSELEAVEHIFKELDGNEGLLVASKIADKVGITRSVIVNALRKFESAGVIESRSLGMKGTHIKILNNKLLDELKKIK
ncbi:MAG: GTP-sensing pleiotropic transcriptional regulator CodY [Clostridium sp.]|uniref:GTP-sensing pleiotropic transcriptional regulator CodY n=1 Tax=Clostridium sp. TaxID=1506 RepID=UPI0025BFE70B|nr:GTP-sensing pleiotropic transcriptional regulator CodY [Clostridium sp.]MCH3963997.1 GTP-sensing pleiotropic transcriptional regulator CodY [Clostridium sp.]MCI1716198.1 GTP-sensing pleiotropic transcriptional regulator CodY [Clostridium sp.]MCI1800562.1 GTP-sensing pleiotropic transcriptional regulator CodY [Clostridium sp.]MCI1814375.1 GTP-sensing pleiotropic transcriptional regulator CodY [Clostridium sp.]MCI1871274.1 GTP-sensing pleiotropic transcriptional regulator CodY [Clostridium sp